MEKNGPSAIIRLLPLLTLCLTRQSEPWPKETSTKSPPR
nr:MAG TPA: hypothetical protein [Caudoviricetes sp.]